MGLTLTLLTPQRRLVEPEPIQELFAPGVKGQLDILPLHANFLTLLETGVLRWKTEAGWKRASVSTGLLEIFNENITVLAEVSEMSHEIDLNRAKAAEVKARQKLDEGNLDESNFRKYDLKLKRAVARISIATTDG